MSDFKRIVFSVGTIVYFLLGMFGLLYAFANYEDNMLLLLHGMIIVAMFNMSLTLYALLILAHKQKRY